METFGLSAGASLLATVLTVVVLVGTGFWLFDSAPQRHITITAGAKGSSFYNMATNYQAVLERKGVMLNILESEGSAENLKRLLDRSSDVDIGFVQGGLTNGNRASQVVSLGSISFQPMLIFYRSATPIQLLSQLQGQRLVVGSAESGTRALAMTLLELNGISNSTATFVDLDAAAAAKALEEGSVDAIFLMGDSASTEVMRGLLRSKNVRLYDVTQADGYVRRITYLSKLDLPKGSIDFGQNIPDHDVSLIGPTVELLAKSDLHPALSDLLLETAQKVNGKASLMRKQGEFPNQTEHDFPISSDAQRYYKSGKGFFYRYLPFWMASMANRIIVAFIPVVLLLVPALRLIPALFRWRMQMLIFRWYRSLLALEKDVQARDARAQRQKYLTRLDQIEGAVNKMKVPASFADAFYGLRGHIGFVRERIGENESGN